MQNVTWVESASLCMFVSGTTAINGMMVAFNIIFSSILSVLLRLPLLLLLLPSSLPFADGDVFRLQFGKVMRDAVFHKIIVTMRAMDFVFLSFSSGATVAIFNLPLTHTHTLIPLRMAMLMA